MITKQSKLRWITLTFFLSVCAFLPCAFAQANLSGQWTTLPQAMPLNPVHIAMMHNGKVLVIAGSGFKSNPNFLVAVWNPQTETFAMQSESYDMFCNGMVIQSDGRPL